jgi:hypothetical protein
MVRFFSTSLSFRYLSPRNFVIESVRLPRRTVREAGEIRIFIPLLLLVDTARISELLNPSGPTVARPRRKYPFAPGRDSDRQASWPGLLQMAIRLIQIRRQ